MTGPVEGGVGLAMPAGVEPVATGGHAGAGWDRAASAEFGERIVGAEPFGVVAEHDQDLRCCVGSDAECLAHGRDDADSWPQWDRRRCR